MMLLSSNKKRKKLIVIKHWEFDCKYDLEIKLVFSFLKINCIKALFQWTYNVCWIYTSLHCVLITIFQWQWYPSFLSDSVIAKTILNIIYESFLDSSDDNQMLYSKFPYFCPKFIQMKEQQQDSNSYCY